MDSVTQFVLGAAVGEAVLGRKIGNKAPLWGGLVATLPDLDVFIPLGDVVKDFTYHRSATHSLLVLAALTPLVVWLIDRVHPHLREFRTRWLLLVYLAFATHVLLDSFTVYGTQIFWPLSSFPVAWSTVFIIDPAYTLPLALGVFAALIMTRQTHRGHLFNRWGLILSSIYLSWTVAAKFIVDHNIESDLASQNIKYRKILTTPAPFNSLLWRAVVTDQNGYYEAFYSVFDRGGGTRFRHYPSDESLLSGIEEHWPVQRLKWFSKGFYSVALRERDIVISDLRMGVEPDYVFRFKVGQLSNPHTKPSVPRQIPNQWNMGLLEKIWQRIWDQSVDLE